MRRRLTVVGSAAALAAALGCGGGTNAPPARTPTAADTPADAGMPPPPRSAKKGVIVPSDMGLGQGPSGPATTSGTPPPESPVLGAPNIGN
jgi:hypothetical protein